MRKCYTYEVSTLVISFAAQCVEGVQFNWVRYLCSEFLMNFREAQDGSKTFHYSWVLLSIMLISWDLPKDTEFPPVENNLAEAAMFASLWAKTDVAWIEVWSMGEVFLVSREK